MQWYAIATIALVAISSTSLAAPTERAPAPLPIIAQFPQISIPELLQNAIPQLPEVSIPQLPQISIPPISIPSTNVDLSNLDDTARVQARALLDEVVSRYPTLIDSFASLLNTQSLLSTPGLMQTLRSPDLPQSSSLFQLPELPQLPQLPQLPKLSDVLPNVPSLPSLTDSLSLPGLPGLGASRDSTSPLSTAVDVVLSNLRGFASSPLQFSPLRLNLPGGTPINTYRGLQVPKVMVPLVLTFPNEEGLSPEELAESIKKKIREQSSTTEDGSLNAMVSLDPLMLTRVVDVQPPPPPKENINEDLNKKPFRRTVPGSLLTGNTDVQIFWEDPDTIKPVEETTDNVRLGLTDIENNLVPVTYPRA